MAASDWSDLRAAVDSNAKTEIYQSEVPRALEVAFPLITWRRRSTDPPWFNARITKKVKQRRGVYRREGKSARWKRLKKHAETLIEKRRDKYVLSQKDAFLAADGIEISSRT